MPFSKRTLLVVGAGASAELGFPVGSALKEQIRVLTNISFNGYNFDGDKQFCRLLETFARVRFEGVAQPIVDACNHIHKNVLLSGSIDQFLSSHQADPVVVECAKLAIASEIAKAESLCHLNNNTFSRSHCDFVYLKDTWLPRLWARLQNGEPIQEWQKFFGTFRVITFNYDRCIEQFLSLALNGFCKVELNQATQSVEKLPIVHVYGSLGNLGRSGGEYCQFGADNNFIPDAAKRILTFSETVQENVVQQIAEYCEWAERIVFLGFSFANVNMNLFPKIEGRRKIIGSSYKMSRANADLAKARLDQKFSRGVAKSELADVPCAQRFDDFDLLLT